MADQSLTTLIEECRRGREAAMQAFYERFYSYALSVCLAYASDREDAREILNDGFLKVFRHLSDLKNEAVLLPWLRRIMVNTAIDFYRKRKQKIIQIPLDRIDYPTIEEPYLNEEGLFAQLSAEHILTVIQQLPTPYRLVFSLYVLDGCSHREIAERLGLVESTSRAHLTEANRLLRRLLANQTVISHERTGR